MMTHGTSLLQDDSALSRRIGLEHARVSEPNRNEDAARVAEFTVHVLSPVVTEARQSKSFVAVRLPMKSTDLCALSTVSCGALYTPKATLSTQVVARNQLRDIVFVSRASTGSYITTGVETRTPIECRPTPAGPVVETESRVSRRIVTHSISSR